MAGQNGKRTPKSNKQKDLAKENARLQRENTRLQVKLKRAEGLLDLQKKAAALLDQLREQNEKSE